MDEMGDGLSNVLRLTCSPCALRMADELSRQVEAPVRQSPSAYAPHRISLIHDGRGTSENRSFSGSKISSSRPAEAATLMIRHM